MVEGIEGLREKWILEPSAGKGDILDYLIDDRHYRDFRETMSVIESDPELQATLRGKGYKVVASDFLSYHPSIHFDLILMNPPFDTGVDHILHAWNILYSGDIICLLNAETILNPYSEKRKLLANVIEQHGTYEILGDVFKTAERKTDVNVVLVRLHKEAKENIFDFEERDHEKEVSIEADQKFELTSPDRIKDIVDRFEAAKNSFADVWKAYARTASYISGLRDSEKTLLQSIQKGRPISGYNSFVTSIREKFWDKVFSMSDFESRMTTRIRDDFEKFCKENNGMEFTVENIQGILGDLIMSIGKISEQCVVDVFDLFTKYYEENRVHVEGWKTNSQWQANRRIILPRVVSRWMTNSFNIEYRSRKEIDDIDKAMCALEGKRFNREIVDGKSVGGIKTIVDTIAENNLEKYGISEFFELRWYNKGTLHLFFRDEALWKRFNITACKGKNWLPGD